MSRSARRLLAAAAWALLVPFAAEAASIRFDQVDYSVEPGEQVTVRVEFDVFETMIDVAAVSANVRIDPIGGATPGAVTTSRAQVTTASTGPYIIQDAFGLNTAGTPTTMATTVLAGDFTSMFQNEQVTTGVYSFIDVVWQAAAAASGDYALSFIGVGSGTAGFTYLANQSDVDHLTPPGGAATIHIVPEPQSAALLALAGFTALLARGRRQVRANRA